MRERWTCGSLRIGKRVGRSLSAPEFAVMQNRTGPPSSCPKRVQRASPCPEGGAVVRGAKVRSKRERNDGPRFCFGISMWLGCVWFAYLSGLAQSVPRKTEGRTRDAGPVFSLTRQRALVARLGEWVGERLGHDFMNEVLNDTLTKRRHNTVRSPRRGDPAAGRCLVPMPRLSYWSYNL